MKRIKKISVALLGMALLCGTGITSCGPSDENPVVPEKQLKGITITKGPNKTDYETGDIFDPTGMVVMANYDDDSSEEVADYTYPKTPLSESDTKVTISYKGKTAVVNITVKFVLKCTGIEIEDKPTKTKYIVGETFDPSGMKVIAKYNDNSKVVITDYTIDKTGPLTLDDKTITITYEGFKATINITVEEVKIAGIKVTTEPNKLRYIPGETFDPTGIVVSTFTNSGELTEIPFEELTFDKEEPLTLEDKEVTITYQDTMTCSLQIDVSTSRLTSIRMDREPNYKSFVTGQRFDPVGMVIIGVHEDGTTSEITDYVVPSEPLTLDDKEITISYCGLEIKYEITVEEKVTSVNIDSLKTIRIEGEYLDTTKASMRQDFIDAGRTFVESGENASNGQNICGYNPGTIFEIPISTDKESTIVIIARMAHSDVNYDIREGFEFKVDEQVLTPDEVHFEMRYGNDFWNWKEFRVGVATIEPGEHTFSLNVKAGHPNIDCFDFMVTQYGDERIEKTVESLKLLSGPTKTKYEIGETFDPTGIQLEATYNDWSKEIVEDYTIDKTGELTIADEYVTLTYMGEEVRIPITVGKEYGFKILDVGDKSTEFENFDLSNASAAIEENASASNGKFVSQFLEGDTISFTLYSHEDSTARMSFRAANEGAINFDKTVKVTIDDEVITSNNPTFTNVFNWTDVDFGELDFAKGEHTVTIELLTSAMGLQLDSMTFFVNKYGDKVAPHDLEGIYVKEMPAKTRYLEGETFDPTGLVIYGKYSDLLDEEITEYTIDKTEPLTLSDTVITVKAGEFETTFNIEVRPYDIVVTEANDYKLEAENLDKTNLVDDGGSFIENSGDFSSNGQNLGHIAGGYIDINFKTSEKFNLVTTLKFAFPEEVMAKQKIGKVEVDGREIQFEDVLMGAAPDNTYWNYKDIVFNVGEIEAGAHVFRITFIGGGNLDYFNFNFSK